MMKVTEEEDKSTPGLIYSACAESKLDQDAIHDFSLHSDGNRVALLGSSSEVITLELTPKISYIAKFPYNCASMKLTENRPLGKLMKNVKIQNVYINCDLLESQDLALEPAYVDLCSTQPPEPKLVHVAWSPQPLHNDQELLAVLTNYGAFNFYTKEWNVSTWHQLPIDLVTLFSQVVVPRHDLDPSSITKFSEFQAYIDRYWITAFVWRPCKTDEHILIAGTAFGHLLLVKFNAAADTIIEHFCTNSNMNRITCLTVEDDLLLVGNIQGAVKLFKIHQQSFELVECLWSREDRMGIQQAVVTYHSDQDVYSVLFTKSAHVLAYSIGRSGKMYCSKRLYIGGLKLSGLVSITSSTFILTSVNNVVHHITLTLSEDKKLLNIVKDFVRTDIDTINLQILGVAISKHKNLLTLMLFRNQEYDIHQSVYGRRTSLLKVGKLSNTDALSLLNSKLIDDMLDYTDLLAVLRLDIINDSDITQYINFLPLANVKFPILLEEKIQQSMQIKYLFTTTLVQVINENRPKSSLSELCKYHLEFLQPALAIAHILQRLEYLERLDVQTSFQKRTVRLMKSKYQKYTEEMKELKTQANALTESIESFLQMATVTLKMFAEGLTSSDLDQNESEHKEAHQCSVSFMPLELSINSRYCLLCGRNAQFDESLLRELYAPDERIRCPYCRCSFHVENAFENK